MKLDNSLLDVFRSACFWSAFFGWIAAQTIKMLAALTHTRKLDFNYLVSTGGMPSAHSAMVAGLMTAIGLQEGFGSPIFVLALGLALVVMFDASTVRRAAGLQARLLNEIVDELVKSHRFSERKMKELLGHTRLEVFMGFLVGALVAMLVTSLAARCK